MAAVGGMQDPLGAGAPKETQRIPNWLLGQFPQEGTSDVEQSPNTISHPRRTLDITKKKASDHSKTWS